MQTDLTAEGITFNDLPAAMSKMLNKVERLEVTLSSLREDIRKSMVEKPLYFDPFGQTGLLTLAIK